MLNMKMLKLLVVGKIILGGAVQKIQSSYQLFSSDENGDVPGWVLVVLMTTGLVTGIWTLAAPKLSSLLNDSLNSMNSIR
jgi:hypothetical protein